MKTRKTRQKEAVSSAIQKTDSFFTAEELHHIIGDKGIGLSSVYRILKKMRNDGLIHSYRCNNRLVYSREKKSHCHFLCEETGKIIHFDVDSLDFLQDKIPGTIESFQIVVKGRCNDCKG